MSNNKPLKVFFKIGQEVNANDVQKLPLEEGQITFSTEKTTGGINKAYIYIDKKDNTGEIQRIKISSEYANRAINDEDGSNIQSTYVKHGTISIDDINKHIFKYKNNVNNELKIELPYVLLDGDTMTGSLYTLGSMSAAGGFLGDVKGNIKGDQGSFRKIIIKGKTEAKNTYDSKNPRIDFSSNTEDPEIISLIFTDKNTINTTEGASPHSLTLRGNDSSIEPLFITPRLKVGTKLDSLYAFNADSALIHNWIETIGNYGWKSSTLGGGIYMPDINTVSIYGNKNFKVPVSTVSTILEGILKVGLISGSNYAMVVSNSEITLGNATSIRKDGCNLTTINGHLVINSAKNTDTSYNEGIRINKSNTSETWSGITIGGAENSTASTSIGTWFVGCKNGNFYVTHNNRDNASLQIIGQLINQEEKGFIVKPRVGINVDNINTNYFLEVNGVSYLKGRTYFENGISLHSPTETGIPTNTGIFFKNLATLAAPTASSFGQGQIQFYADKDTTANTKNRTGRNQKESAILSISGESGKLTHQLSFDISNKTSIDGNLYHRVGDATAWEDWAILLDNTNVSWSNWTNGTTSGPIANISIGGTNIASSAVPAATETISGVITTGAQTFSGNKIFKGTLTVNSSTVGLGNNITLGKGSVDDTARSIIVQGKAGNIILTSPVSGVRTLSFTNVNSSTVNAIEASNSGITFNGSLSGTAARAISDASGNNIVNTYATKTEMNDLLAIADAMIFKGTIGNSEDNPTITSLPAIHNAGWTYKVITENSYIGKQCEVGDLIICIKDGTVASNNDWTIVQTNVDRALVSPLETKTGALAMYSNNTGIVVQSSIKRGNTTCPIYIDENGVPQSITAYQGNAASATVLYNKRKINGTIFNGSEDIVTNKWGVSRPALISDGTNFGEISNIDGSDNIILKLPTTIKASLDGIATKATNDAEGNNIINTYATKNELTSLETNVNNLLTDNDVMIYKGTIGGTSSGANVTALPDNHKVGWTYKVITDGTYAGKRCEAGNLIICITDGTTTNNNHWITNNVGNGVLNFSSSVQDGALVIYDGSTGKKIKQVITTGNSTCPIYIDSNGKPQAITSYSGNAASATILQTGRQINGTIFNGSENITTSKWGTARNISISDNSSTNTGTAVSVDGSGNITLKLPATIQASLSGTATNATNATNDASGNNIANTYATKTALNTLSGTVNGLLAAADAMIFKGTIGTGGTITSLPSTSEAGWTYKVITNGTYAGITCEVGDLIICIKDATTFNNANWTVVQTNTDGTITGPVSSTNGALTLFDGTSGKNIKQATNKGSTTLPIYIDNSGIPQTITSYEGVAAKTNKANITSTVNAIAYYSDTTGTFSYISSSSGAFYSTGTNTKPVFGTLPIGQGGTGITSFTINKIYYASGSTTLTASSHSIDNSHLAINNSINNSYNFYVNGPSYLNGEVWASTLYPTELVLPTTASSRPGAIWIG